MIVSITVNNLKRIVKNWSKFVKNFKLYKSSQKSISSTYSDLTSPYDEHEILFDNFINWGVRKEHKEANADRWRIEKLSTKA